MRYHKLKAGECPGTYVVTEPVTEQDLLRIATPWIAPASTHGKWSKGLCYFAVPRLSRSTITPVVTRNPAILTGSLPRLLKRPWRWSMCDCLTIWWSALRVWYRWPKEVSYEPDPR